MIKIDWISVYTLHGSCVILATKDGICWCGSPKSTLRQAEDWVKKTFNEYSLQINSNNPLLQKAAERIHLFFSEVPINFEFNFDLYGTPFQVSVWKAIQTIPYGQTITYSDLAEKIHKPKAVRSVGAACGQNPVSLFIPCHRVIGKSGALTGYAGGLSMKRMLLDLEHRAKP